MAKIVEVTNPVTGQPTQVDQLDHTAQQIDDAVGRALPGGYYDKWVSQLPGQNLLDNWYFGNPVNQKGQTEYTTSGLPTIDKWIRHGGTTTLNDGYITLLGYAKNLDQVLDVGTYKFLRGKTITMSILGRGNLSIVSEDYANGYRAAYLQSAEFTIASLTVTVRSDSDRFVYHIQPQDENPCDIIAVKLELGSTQTLAHQDENGNWQLNALPRYADTLARCQRYQFGINPKRYGRPAIGVSTSQSSGAFVLNLPVTMRAIPTVTFRNLQVFYSGQNYNVTGITVSGLTDNSVLLDIFFDAGTTEIPIGAALILVSNDGSELFLNANL